MHHIFCQQIIFIANRLIVFRLVNLYDYNSGDHGDTKIDSHMTAICSVLSNCGSFLNPPDETSPILFLIKTSHAPNWSKELDPFSQSPPLLMVTIQ